MLDNIVLLLNCSRDCLLCKLLSDWSV